jgi:hypothetical protein
MFEKHEDRQRYSLFSIYQLCSVHQHASAAVTEQHTLRNICRQHDEDEYWERVAQFEPWALEDDPEQAHGSLMSHMMQ